MVFDEKGEQKLISLKQAEIASIMLEAVVSPFTIKDEENNDLALIRKSGIAISEDVETKTVQQVDLVV